MERYKHVYNLVNENAKEHNIELLSSPYVDLSDIFLAHDPVRASKANE